MSKQCRPRSDLAPIQEQSRLIWVYSVYLFIWHTPSTEYYVLCLPFCIHLLDALLYGRAICSNFRVISAKSLGVQIFRHFTVPTYLYTSDVNVYLFKECVAFRWQLVCSHILKEIIFLPYTGIAAILFMWQCPFKETFVSPDLWRLLMKFRFNRPNGLKMLTNGRQMLGYTISSPMSLSLKRAKNTS